MWINELFVDEAYRKNHIAEKMLEYIESWAEKNTIRYVSLVTGKENEAAQKLYTKKGYTIDTTVWIDKTIRKWESRGKENL